MSGFEGLAYGLGVAFTLPTLFAAFIGALTGTVVGVLPGIGTIVGSAILLPLTYTMDPTAALAMLAGVYYGSMYGGSTTAALLNIPGEAESVITAIDGFQMTKQGRAGPALGIMALGSFIAGTVSVLLVAIVGPLLGDLALVFGSAEYFALTAGGLILLSRILGGSLGGSLLPMTIGLALATVGEEGGNGTYRFTFGSIEFAYGFSLAAVAIGLFGLTELMKMAEDRSTTKMVQSLRMRELMPTRTDLKRSRTPFARGTALGFFLGLIPGPATTMATFGAYRLEQAVSKNRKELGTGAVEGIAGPEAANNAAATSALMPILVLGLPFSATFVFMLSALYAQGITPGPLLMTQHPDIFWGVIASMLIGNVILVILNVNLIRVWVAVLRIPSYVLIPTILMVMLFGAYAARNDMFDIYVALALGVLGYVALRRLNFQLVPLLLGLVLGPLMEKYARQGLTISGGDISYFLTPISFGIWLVVLVSLVAGAFPVIARMFARSTADAG